VALHPNNKNIMFSTSQGVWQFIVMLFDLCNAPAMFERLMEVVLGEPYLRSLPDVLG
jgi:hypothetical protein